MVLLMGCSRLIFFNYFNQLRPESWRVLSEKEDPIFAYEYKCEMFSMRMRTIDRGTWSMVGPPLIPILPLGLFSRSDSKTLYFDIEVTNFVDSIKIDFPTLAIIIDSSSKINFPIDSFLVQQDFERIREEGLYHWDFKFGALNYMYKFNMDGYADKSIDIVFLKPYLDCNIPTLKYVVQSVTKYQPFIIPSGH